MLTGEELCTSGEATLGGFDIKTQQNQVRCDIGNGWGWGWGIGRLLFFHFDFL
jgi:hypothetical protein